jgi:hypothetical protein
MNNAFGGQNQGAPPNILSLVSNMLGGAGLPGMFGGGGEQFEGGRSIDDIMRYIMENDPKYLIIFNFLVTMELPQQVKNQWENSQE